MKYSFTILLLVCLQHAAKAQQNCTLNFDINPSMACNGQCLGEADIVNLTGGVAPYSFLWSNYVTTMSATSLCAGEYCVTVSDNNGCTASKCVTIEERTWCVDINQPYPICQGSYGTLNTTLSGDLVAPFNYLWSSGDVGASIEFYSGSNPTPTCAVTVFDANGCTASASHTSVVSAALEVSGYINYNSTGPEGTLITKVLPNNPPYTYQWLNGATTSTLPVTNYGFYAVTVTNAIGCTGTKTFLQSNNCNGSEVSLFQQVYYDAGFSNLSALTTVTSPSFIWSVPPGATLPGFSANTISFNFPGEYCVTVTNSSLCSATACTTNDVFNIAGTITQPKCIANCDGAIALQPYFPSFCQGPVTYLWEDGSTGDTRQNLCPGTYYVTATCGGSITKERSFTLNSTTEGNTTPIISNNPAYCNFNLSSGTCEQVCPGSSVTYEFNPPACNNSPSQFYWQVVGASSYVVSPDYRSCTITWGNVGTGSVRISGSGGSVCFSGYRCIEILPRPQARMGTSPAPSPTGILTVCKGQTVNFLNQSLQAEQYSWHFSDDLSNTTTENPTHTYNVPGTHTALLIARNDCLCADSTWLTVEVLDAITPLIDCVSAVCPGDEVTYTTDAPCTNFQWEISPNGTILSGGSSTDNSITIGWTAGTQGTIALTATSCQSNTCPATAVATVPILSNEAEIKGRNRVCLGSEETYTIEQFKGSRYEWKIIPSYLGTILRGHGRHEVDIKWSAYAHQGKLIVKYDNCYLGCSGADTLDVLIRPPFGIKGNLETCPDTWNQFSTLQLPAGQPVNSNWKIYNPDGVQVSNWNIQNSANANHFFGNNPGNYRITAYPTGTGLSNTCSDSAIWEINVVPKPDKPTGITGPTVFCPGEPLVFSAQGIEPFHKAQWQIKSNDLLPTSASGETTIVTFTAGLPRWVALQQITADALACKSDTVRLNLSPVPNIPISGTLGICVNETANYTAQHIAGLTYNWSIIPANAGVVRSGQGTSSVQIDWNQAGTHTVQLSVCGQTQTLSVNVWGLPVSDPIYPPGLCPGATSIVSANGSDPGYQWRTGTGQLLGTLASITLGAGSYALVVTDANGCTDTKEFSIDAWPDPILTISTTQPTRFCNNSQHTLIRALTTNDADYDYVWRRNGQPFGPNANSITTNEYGEYTCVATNQFGCTRLDGPIELIPCSPGGSGGGTCFPGAPGGHPIACPDIAIQVLPTALCDSFGFGLTGTIPSNATVTWIYGLSGGASVGTDTGPTATFTFPDANQYIVIAQVSIPNVGVCAVADSAFVWAKAKFDPIIACPGVPAAFTDASAHLPQTTITNWNWNFGDPGSGTLNTSNEHEPTHAFSSSFNFPVTLTVTAASGCTSSAISTVPIPPLPAITFLPQSAGCAGSTLSLAIHNAATFSHVRWDFGDPASGALNLAEGTSVVHSFANSGVFSASVTATNLFGCSATATTPVNISPNTLNGDISPATNSICEGTTITLNAPNGGAAATYAWSDGSTAPTLNVGEAGVYKVTISTPNGCTFVPPPREIKVNPAPIGEIKALIMNDLGQTTDYAEQQHSVCFGDDVLLQVFDNGTYDITWNNGAGTGESLEFSEARDSLLPVGSYTYEVILTNATTGCSAISVPFSVDVRPVPGNFTAQASQNCAGTPSTVSYVGPNIPTWQLFWNNGEIGPSFTTLEPGIFFVRAVNEYGCQAKSPNVIIHPGPNLLAIPGGCHTRCNPDSICVAPMPEIVSWQWFFNGSPIPNATSSNFVATQTGTYHAELVDNLGCNAVSDPLNLTLYDGFGDINGQVWSDVNNNGLVDAADTLVSGIHVQLWQTDTLAGTGFTTNGHFTFGNYLSVPYTTAIDTALLPAYWEVVIGTSAAQLSGCDDLAEVDLLIRRFDCPIRQSALQVSVCPASSYDYYGVPISAGSSQIFTYTDIYLCDSLVTVSVEALPIATSTRTERICADATYTFLGVEMEPGTTQQFTLQNAVTGCDSILTITVEAWPTATSTRTERICANATYTFLGVEMVPGTTQQFTLQNAVTGCDSLVNITVEALPLADSSLTVQVCPYDYFVYGDSLLFPGKTYIFHLLTQQGECDSTVTLHVEAWPALDFDLSATVSCTNAPTGNIEISGLSGGAGNAVFSIDPTQNIWQNNLIFSELPPGLHTITARDQEGCTYTDSIGITAIPPIDVSLPAQIHIPCDSTSVLLQPVVEGCAANLQYQWSTGHQGRNLLVAEPGNFTLQISNLCETQSATTEVIWGELPAGRDLVYVPNVVTPGDENTVNTIFQPAFSEYGQVLRYRMEVFDRWGNLVFRTFDASKGWDTNVELNPKGQPARLADSQVFVWWLEADLEWCGRIITLRRKGDVTLLR